MFGWIISDSFKFASSAAKERRKTAIGLEYNNWKEGISTRRKQNSTRNRTKITAEYKLFSLKTIGDHVMCSFLYFRIRLRISCSTSGPCSLLIFIWSLFKCMSHRFELVCIVVPFTFRTKDKDKNLQRTLAHAQLSFVHWCSNSVLVSVLKKKNGGSMLVLCA